MTSRDVYEELADMQDKEDVVGIPKTESFLKLLRLQFTPEEAELALKVRFTPMTLSEIHEKTGMDKERLKNMLLTMADKGTVFYDPAEKDPAYKVVGSAAPGLIETGLWGNIKYPYSIELGKALYNVLKEWCDAKLCTLGFPFAPVWGGTIALPVDAQPAENLAEIMKQNDHFSVSPCPCRLSHWLVDPGNHCDHILETCLHTGELSRWAVKHGMGRQITLDETLALLEAATRDGLVSTLNINGCVCNCCVDCCAIFHGQKKGVSVFVPSPFEAKVDEDACNACGDCADRCPADAIQVNGIAAVQSENCLGCGVCVPNCRSQSMKLVRR